MAMAFHFHHLIYLLLPLLTTATTSFLLPIIKDTSSSPKYYTTFTLGTPPVSVHLAIDLGDPYTWLACDLATTYNHTSSYHPISYNTSKCLSYSGPNAASYTCFQPPSPTCNHRQCAGWAITSPNLDQSLGYLVVDVMYPLYHRLSHSNSLLKTTLRRFPFVCGDFNNPLLGLPNHIAGILTLSKSPISLQSQLLSLFNTPRKFSICLPSSASGPGAVYFGGGPYKFSVVSTRLVPNPHALEEPYYKGDHSVEYYVQLRSIIIDRTPVKLNSSLLRLDGKGEGGTLLSTVFPYTRMHSAIYKPFTDLFVVKAEAMNVTRVAAVMPFAACFDSKSVSYKSRTGVGLPIIDLVMEGKSVVRWRIYGSNSMVKVGGDVECLAFVDGGLEVPNRGLGLAASVVVGGKQLEDNLVEFDLEGSKVGITSSLLRFGTTCSQLKGS